MTSDNVVNLPQCVGLEHFLCGLSLHDMLFTIHNKVMTFPRIYVECLIDDRLEIESDIYYLYKYIHALYDILGDTHPNRESLWSDTS